MPADIKFESHVPEFEKRTKDEINRMLHAVGLHMKGAVKRTLRGDRSGKPYKVPGTTPSIRVGFGKWKKRGKWYIASAPGEPPAVRLGHLRNSIDYKVDSFNLEVKIGTPLEKYPEYLEFGTPGGKILARPYMRPTFDKEKSTIVRMLKRRWM